MIEIINHLDKKYLVNYKINFGGRKKIITPEEVELIMDRTASSVVAQTQDQMIFAEEIVDVKFQDILPLSRQIAAPKILKKKKKKKFWQK